MSAARPRVLLLVHAADRIGPPMVALSHLLGWRTRPGDGPVVDLVLHRDGPLRTELAGAVDSITVLDAPLDGTEVDRDRARATLGALPRPDVVVVNTAWTAQLLALLPAWDSPVVTLVHELETGLRTHLGPHGRRLLLERSDLLVAGSDAIARNLLDNHAVEPNRVVVVHEHVSDPGPLPGTVERAAARSRLGGDGHAAVVVAAGTADWRKAPDLFVHLADLVTAAAPHGTPGPRFTWIGADEDAASTDGALDAARHDRRRLGLDAVVRFHPVVEDLRDLLAGADVFVLPSREDGFPLVCLEAAAAGVPIACFDTGGAPELVGDGAGVVVPYPDLDRFAGAVRHLLADVDLRAEMGRRGRDLVARRFSASVGAPALWNVVSGVLGGAGRRPSRSLHDGQTDQAGGDD